MLAARKKVNVNYGKNVIQGILHFFHFRVKNQTYF